MFETLNGDHAGQVLSDDKIDLSINNKHRKRRERGGYGKKRYTDEVAHLESGLWQRRLGSPDPPIVKICVAPLSALINPDCNPCLKVRSSRSATSEQYWLGKS